MLLNRGADLCAHRHDGGDDEDRDQRAMISAYSTALAPPLWRSGVTTLSFSIQIMIPSRWSKFDAVPTNAAGSQPFSLDVENTLSWPIPKMFSP